MIEAIKAWESKLKEMEEDKRSLNEFMHDGTHIPRHPSRRNPTNKPTLYYIAVDYDPNLSNYGQYVRPDGGLTDDVANSSFNHAGVTTNPDLLIKRVNDAVAKYGKDMYVMVFKQEYSYGNQTMKNHLRGGLLLDRWNPKGKYWQYDFKPILQLQYAPKASTTLRMNEAGYGEKAIYLDDLDANISALKPILDKFINIDKGAVSVSGVNQYWNEMMWIALSVAKLIVDECPDQDAVKLASKIVELGSAYMI